MLGKSSEPYIDRSMKQSSELEALPGPSGIERQQKIPSTPSKAYLLYCFICYKCKKNIFNLYTKIL